MYYSHIDGEQLDDRWSVVVVVGLHHVLVLLSGGALTNLDADVMEQFLFTKPV